jgi:hypothetical protein
MYTEKDKAFILSFLELIPVRTVKKALVMSKKEKIIDADTKEVISDLFYALNSKTDIEVPLKLFKAFYAPAMSLKPASRKLLDIFLSLLKRNAFLIEIAMPDLLRISKMKKNTLYKSLQELYACGLLFRRNQHSYYINPVCYFKGNRIKAFQQLQHITTSRN